MCAYKQDKGEKFVRYLRKWAKDNTRDFPWRKTKDPYRILIAEIMLQRTRANQVVRVFESFISNYPNPLVLAGASVKRIRKSIHSLGLEKKAEGLKRLAKQLVDDYGGRIPDKKKDLLDLHWVGRYTANAVLCHAYDSDVPTVDANFARVLQRVFSLQAKEPVQRDEEVWSFAETILSLSKGKSRELNLAIIDLASLICTIRNPQCAECPLNRICDYFRLHEGKDEIVT